MRVFALAITPSVRAEQHEFYVTCLNPTRSVKPCFTLFIIHKCNSVFHTPLCTIRMYKAHIVDDLHNLFLIIVPVTVFYMYLKLTGTCQPV